MCGARHVGATSEKILGYKWISHPSKFLIDKLDPYRFVMVHSKWLWLDRLLFFKVNTLVKSINMRCPSWMDGWMVRRREGSFRLQMMCSSMLGGWDSCIWTSHHPIYRHNWWIGHNELETNKQGKLVIVALEAPIGPWLSHKLCSTINITSTLATKAAIDNLHHELHGDIRVIFIFYFLMMTQLVVFRDIMLIV